MPVSATEAFHEGEDNKKDVMKAFHEGVMRSNKKDATIIIPSEARFPLEVPFELAWLPKFRKCRSRLPEHLKRADFVLAVL